jgi:hypothetical protein
MKMEQLIKDQIKSISAMDKKDRNILLCKLSVKEMLNTIEPDEIV